MIRAILIYLNRLLDRLLYVRAVRRIKYGAWLDACNRIVQFLNDDANDAMPRRPWPADCTLPDGRPRYTVLRKPFVTRNGHSMSLQFSATHYCKIGDNPSDLQLELWNCMPSPALRQYGTGEDPYAYVPLGVVAMYVCFLEGLPAALPVNTKEN